MDKPARLDGTGRPFITLAQFLKHMRLVDSGANAKDRIRLGGVMVNGEEDLRPGRKLHDGDKVGMGTASHAVHLDETGRVVD